jgi:hypothetical protein
MSPLNLLSLPSPLCLLLPSLLLPSPPPIGSYIWSTQLGHGVIICWHCFHSQLWVAGWRQIE